MHLQVSADAPVILRFAADAILALHVAGGFGGVFFGTAALLAPKGGRLHRLAGTGFFVSMLALAGVGAAVAPFMPRDQIPNTLAGVFTLYLVATAWATVRRTPGETGRFEIGALALVLAAAAASVGLVSFEIIRPGVLRGPQAMAPYIFALLTGIASVCDFVVIRQGGVSGFARTRRHLWRMSVALIVAVGSLAAQPVALPPALRDSPLFLVAILAVLAAMVVWLVRLRTRVQRQPASQAGSRSPLSIAS